MGLGRLLSSARQPNDSRAAKKSSAGMGRAVLVSDTQQDGRLDRFHIAHELAGDFH